MFCCLVSESSTGTEESVGAAGAGAGGGAEDSYKSVISNRIYMLGVHTRT